MANGVSHSIREFIVSNFLYGQECSFADEDSFMGAGIIDSTGVLQLVAYLEETYGITVVDDELIPENLDSVNNVTAYILRKTAIGKAAKVGDLGTGEQA
jgi:acyl carrier protein